MLRRCLTVLTVLSALTKPVMADPVDQQIQQGDWAAALGSYLLVLDHNPDNLNALKGAWTSAVHLGLYDQAAELQVKLNEQDRAALQGDQIALAIRYGRIDARTLNGPTRYQKLDTALTSTDALARDFFRGQTINPEQQRRLIDRMTALVARQRPQLAIDLFLQLKAHNITIPDWAKNYAADAFLTLRQPASAAQLYQQVLAVTPDDFDANLGLFYALVESEQLDQAQILIDNFASRLPLRRHLDGQANTERTSANLVSDQQRVYANRLQEAQQRIEARIVTIPFNQEARSVATSVDLALGWQRRAEMELRNNIVNDAANPNLRAEQAELYLALQRWTDAQTALNTANQLDAELPRVQAANTAMALWRGPELNVDAGFGQGENKDPFGSSDYHIDTVLYSGPINNVWRIFVHNYSASADFYGNSINWVRTGAGVEWRSGDWKASTEINSGEFAKTGVLSSLQWQVDDLWKLVANADSVTNDIQLQAVNAKITAQQISLGIDWQPYDGRKLALETGYSDFSDGNRRHSVIASWFERWISGPRWLAETTLGADASHNSLGYATAYFNPSSDHSAWLTSAVENLSWRSYDWAFRQRLSVTAGNYWQSGFERGTIEAIDYQHRWELGRSAAINYSIGRSLRPYDGVREARNYGAMTLLWRF